ncbi:WD40-repeat-containing domain protein [Aspergillus avenaceus]|uniref:WD40-repeat-containing domain protein n=1 Tax=Aspergillus avenaceus TaxID=36643 RepID=A0A5N6TMT5_ASPAV|nr:WD40-repeat-containing domain protein [Aspergillus avenaceus]
MPTERNRSKARKFFISGTAKNNSKPLNTPDRFVPTRQSMAPSTLFHTSKNPQELSYEEKLLRHRFHKEDPFLSARTRGPAAIPRLRIGLHGTRRVPQLISDSITTLINGPGLSGTFRQVSDGAVWRVGGTPAIGRRSRLITGGSGNFLASGTAAPMYHASFLPLVAPTDEQRKYESRIALALDIDPAARLIDSRNASSPSKSALSPTSPHYERLSPLEWKDNAWKRAETNRWFTPPSKKGKARAPPTLPFRILDAPYLRDDFYCSAMAYSTTCGILAVGLGHQVFLWSETFGVQSPPFSDQHPSNFVTSVTFSSEDGGNSILAVGRHSGTVCLWSVFDSKVRFEVNHPDTITCVAFKQTKSRRISERFQSLEVDAEDLAVGDDIGNIWYYSVEWPEENGRKKFDWQGSMTLLARISAHRQQVCGISWSPDGSYLATGGNDNACLVFDLREIIAPRELGMTFRASNMLSQSKLSLLVEEANQRFLRRHSIIRDMLVSQNQPENSPLSAALLNPIGTLITDRDRTVIVPPNQQKHKLVHSAAVKAIAFAPWQPSLLATGGGLNDRAIHFYHAPSGACLATIDVYAQVTGLIWSKTRREICATFGFAQPEHPYRVAVFAWPSCDQIAAIPWGPNGSSWDRAQNNPRLDCGRALCAVNYPCRPPTYVLDKNDSPGGSSISTLVNHIRLNRGRDVRYRRAVVRPRAKEGGLWCPRTVEEGCIIVASSDQTVKFHEVWSSGRKCNTAPSGPYGNSEILEAMEGLERPGNEVIR